MISVSIIIPVYKVEQYIEDCLLSVMSQTYAGEMECILIDDCGNDASIEIAQRIILGYTGSITFQILKQDRNRGPAAARNAGIRIATGDYLTFLDSDDRMFPNAITEMVQVAVKHKGVDIIQGVIECDQPGPSMDIASVSPAIYPHYSSDKKWCKWNIMNTIPVYPWGKLIRKDFIIDKKLFFDEPLYVHEDDLWRVKASRVSKDIAFCFCPVYWYRNENQESTIHFSDFSRRMIADVKIIRELIEGFEGEDDAANCYKILELTRYTRKIYMWNHSSNKSEVALALKQLYKDYKYVPIPKELKKILWHYQLPMRTTHNLLVRLWYRSIFNNYRARLMKWGRKHGALK